jgi:hypothetical protein
MAMGIVFHRKKTEMDSCKGFRSYERSKKRKFTSVYGRTALMGFLRKDGTFFFSNKPGVNFHTLLCLLNRRGWWVYINHHKFFFKTISFLTYYLDRI